MYSCQHVSGQDRISDRQSTTKPDTDSRLQIAVVDSEGVTDCNSGPGSSLKPTQQHLSCQLFLSDDMVVMRAMRARYYAFVVNWDVASRSEGARRFGKSPDVMRCV